MKPKISHEEAAYTASTNRRIAEIQAMTPERRRKALAGLVEEGVLTPTEAYEELDREGAHQ